MVVSEQRPVPLWQHMLVGKRMFDLFACGPPPRRGGQRPRAARPPASAARRWSTPSWSATCASRSGASTPGRRRPAAAPRPHRPRSGRRRGPTSSSGWTAEGLLPAITFIFSRAGCDAAVAAVPARRAAADRRGRAGRDRADRRASAPARARGGPARPRLLGVARGPAARARRPPRRADAGVQGDGRGTVRPRPGQGGVRHRDAGARASTCRPARWCSSGWSSSTARRTST